MPSKIEDYAIIGDTKTVALVDLTGSIDWWCAPRVDSGAAFAALLGDPGNGRWLIAPKGEVTKITRRYEPDTLILETIFETPTGSVSVSDFMPPQDGKSMIHRIVGVSQWHRRDADGADRALRVRRNHPLGHRDR